MNDMISWGKKFLRGLLRKTFDMNERNTFHLAVCVYSDNSQKLSKCGKNISCIILARLDVLLWCYHVLMTSRVYMHGKMYLFNNEWKLRSVKWTFESYNLNNNKELLQLLLVKKARQKCREFSS